MEQVTVEDVVKLIDLQQTIVAQYTEATSKSLVVYWKNGKLLWSVKYRNNGKRNEKIFDTPRDAVSLYNSLP